MRFKAFTLLELIIASLITGIIGFIIIYFLDDVLQVTQSQLKVKQQEEDVAIFDMLLTNDLFLSDTFYFKNGELEIIKDTTHIQYTWKENTMLRITDSDSSLYYLPIEDFRLNTSNKNQVLHVSYNLNNTLNAIYIDEADYIK